jgi:hypothetical protein
VGFEWGEQESKRGPDKGSRTRAFYLARDALQSRASAGFFGDMRSKKPRHRKKPATQAAPRLEPQEACLIPPCLNINDPQLLQNFESAFDLLLLRGEGGNLDSEIERHDLHQALLRMLDRFVALASDDQRALSGWAGAVLAEVGFLLQRLSAQVGSRNPEFKKRTLALRKNPRHLLVKSTVKVAGDSLDGSPLMRWLIAAEERCAEVRDFLELLSAMPLSPAQRGEIAKNRGFTKFERTIPSAYSKATGSTPNDFPAAVFEKVIWPWLVEKKEVIEAENWYAARIKSIGGSDQRAPSFGNLKKDFGKMWPGLFKRPCGDLRGLERAGL